MNKKLLISAATVIISGCIVYAFSVPAELAANSTIVGQLDNSNAAYVAMRAAGNGSSLLNTIVGVIDLAILAVVWFHKSK